MAYKVATAVQTAAAIRFGSAKVEIGDTVGTLIDIGAARDVKFAHSFDKVVVPSDNAGPVELGIRNELVKMSALMMEINLVNLAQFYSGVFTHSTIAAAPVSITDENVTLDGTDEVALAHKNGANTEVSTIVVTTAAAGATVRNTDYTISVNPAGFTVITRIDGGLFADGDAALVDYAYTPLASRSLKAGGKQTFTAQVMRFTNYDVDDKEFRITIWEATPGGGIVIDFPATDEADPAMIPIEIEGRLDTTKASGEQLFEIQDSQHAS